VSLKLGNFRRILSKRTSNPIGPTNSDQNCYEYSKTVRDHISMETRPLDSSVLRGPFGLLVKDGYATFAAKAAARRTTPFQVMCTDFDSIRAAWWSRIFDAERVSAFQGRRANSRCYMSLAVVYWNDTIRPAFKLLLSRRHCPQLQIRGKEEFGKAPRSKKATTWYTPHMGIFASTSNACYIGETVEQRH
jgi:hypothetical protein